MILLLQLPGGCDFSIGGFADSKWIMHVTTLILMDSSPDKAPLHIPCALAVSESNRAFRSCLILIPQC